MVDVYLVLESNKYHSLGKIRRNFFRQFAYINKKDGKLLAIVLDTIRFQIVNERSSQMENIG